MGVPIFRGLSCVLCAKSCQLLHCCWSITGLPISKCRKNCHTSLGFGDNRQTVSGRLGLLASLYACMITDNIRPMFHDPVTLPDIFGHYFVYNC